MLTQAQKDAIKAIKAGKPVIYGLDMGGIILFDPKTENLDFNTCTFSGPEQLMVISGGKIVLANCSEEHYDKISTIYPGNEQFLDLRWSEADLVEFKLQPNQRLMCMTHKEIGQMLDKEVKDVQ